MGLGYGWLPDYQVRDLLASGQLLELSRELRIEVPCIGITGKNSLLLWRF